MRAKIILFGMAHHTDENFLTANFSQTTVLLLLLLAAMTYNQVHYFRVNRLADFTQNGHTKSL